jgi:tetratricopeptide (TPR) repeat protein/O-antigen ligase
MRMAPEAEPAGGRKTSWEYLPYLVILTLGAILLLVANTDGVGNSRWRYLLYFFVVLMLSLAILYTYGVRRRIRFGKMFSLALGLFVALILLSALSLIWGETTFEGTKALMLLLAFALAFMLAYLVLRGEGKVWLFMSVVTVVAVSVCVYGLIQYFFSFSNQVAFLAQYGIGYQFSDRVFSHFINPNIFASFLNISIPLGLALVMIEKRRYLTFVWGGAVILQLWCLYLTQSRGGWLIFALILILLFLLIPRRVWRERWKTLAVIALLAVVVIALSSLYSPLEEGGDGTAQGVSGWEYSGLDVTAAAGSLKGRMGIWRGGLDMFSSNLAGGVGVGGFATAMQGYQYHAFYSIHAHNYILETGAEAGIVGLLLMLALTLLVLDRIRRVFKGDLKGDIRVICVALWAVAVGFFLHNLIDISWFNPLIGVTLWLCAGALFALTEREKEVGEKEEEAQEEGKTSDEIEAGNSAEKEKGLTISGVFLVVFLAVVVLLSGYLFTTYFLAETHQERGNDLKEVGRALEAIEQYEKSLDSLEANPSVHKNLGDLYAGLYRYGEGPLTPRENSGRALAHYDRAIELEPGDSYKHHEKGILLLLMGGHFDGRRSLRQAQRLYPNNPSPYFIEGQSYLEQELLQDAELKFRETVALLPYYAEPSIVPYRERQGLNIVLDAMTRLVEIMVSKGESEEALEEINQALELLPESGRLYYLRGWVHWQRGELEEALADFRTTAEVEPELAGVHLAIGRIYLQLGDVEMAIIQFELELEVNPWSMEAHEELESVTGGG